MIAQLDLFGVLERPAPPQVARATVPAAAPVAKSANCGTAAEPGLLPGQVRGSGVHASDERPYWKTNAFQYGGEILAYKDTPPPFEMTVRGCRTVIAFGFGFSTHAIDPPGSLYWSDTGFRSFTCSNARTAEEIAREIEAHIDGPLQNHMGLGGKLSPWWPLGISSKIADARWSMKTTVEQFADLGEEKAAHTVATAHARARKLLDEVRAAGFDPWTICPNLPRQGALL